MHRDVERTRAICARCWARTAGLLAFDAADDPDQRTQARAHRASTARTSATPATSRSRSRSSPSASTSSPSTCASTSSDHHSRRGLLMLVGSRRRFLELPPAQRPRGLPRAAEVARPAQVSVIEAGTPVPEFTLTTERRRDVHARGPARPDERARLLPVRLQPRLQRPADALRGGPRRVHRSAARRSTRSRPTPAGRRPPSRRSSAARSSSSPTSSPRARRRARSASCTTAASRSARS